MSTKDMATARPTRREVMAGCGAVSLAAAFRAQPASAQRHRSFKIGDIEITVLSDGHLTLVPRNFAGSSSESEVQNALARAGAKPGETVAVPTNVSLVRSGKELILIDLGAGPNFMASAGKLGDSLTAAGIDPKSITRVILTHGHPDHLWGAIDEFDDSLRFPNAAYVMSEAEWALWMTGDPASKLPASRHNFIPGAVRNLKHLKERLTFVKPGQQVGPNMIALDTSGHTQGHISIELASGNERLIVLGDALTHPVISFEHPEWRPEADHEPDRAVATRRALLERLATDKTRIIGYHLPYPGLGNVVRRGTGYAFAAAS